MLEPSQKASIFFSQATKKIDGIAAYFFSIISVLLVLVTKFMPGSIGRFFVLKIEKDLIFICLIPIVMLVSYAWLNSFTKESLVNSILNAILISILPSIYFFRTFY